MTTHPSQISQTDSPNRSSEDATTARVRPGQWVTPTWTEHQSSGGGMINGVPLPNQFGGDRQCSVTAEAGSTTSDSLRNLQYCMDILLLLKDHLHYYDPKANSATRDYFKGEFERSFRRTFDALLFSINVGGKSLSGDMLAEVSRAIGSLRKTEEPIRAVELVSKFLEHGDPLVVDSMVVALSDFEPEWVIGVRSLKAAANKIAWNPIRDDAISALEALEAK